MGAPNGQEQRPLPSAPHPDEVEVQGGYLIGTRVHPGRGGAGT